MIDIMFTYKIIKNYNCVGRCIIIKSYSWIMPMASEPSINFAFVQL